MTYQSFSRIVISVLFLVTSYFSAIEIKKEFFGKDEFIVVADGVIQGKFESDYACGSKGKYTCYSRYLIIDGKKQAVNLETFSKNKIGDSVRLVERKPNDLTIPSFLLILFGIVVSVCVIVVLLLTLIFFVWWSLFHSSSKSFFRYMNLD